MAFSASRSVTSPAPGVCSCIVYSGRCVVGTCTVEYGSFDWFLLLVRTIFHLGEFAVSLGVLKDEQTRIKRLTPLWSFVRGMVRDWLKNLAASRYRNVYSCNYIEKALRRCQWLVIANWNSRWKRVKNSRRVWKKFEYSSVVRREIHHFHSLGIFFPLRRSW